MTILFVSKLLITRAGLARFAKMFFSQVSHKLSQHSLGSIQDRLREKNNNKQTKKKPAISTTRSRERFFPKSIIILCDSFIEEKNLMQGLNNERDRSVVNSASSVARVALLSNA